MTQKELNKVLRLHKQWLESDRKKGKRADLSCTDLRKLNFDGADLRRINLRNADLRGTFMRYTDLRGANLEDAEMKGTNLIEANLSGANVDFSAWPLWCGSFDVKCDFRLARQLAYHFCRLNCENKEVKAAQNALIKLANKFHRAEGSGVLKPKQIKKTKTNEVRRKGKVNKV